MPETTSFPYVKFCVSHRAEGGDGWESPGFGFLELLWEHSQEATGHSWTKLIGALREALETAISAGLRFDVDDFKKMAKSMRVGYWWGDDGGERFYRIACESRNLSACQAWEAYTERPPFILHGNRLAQGMELDHWPGLTGRVRLNSFSGRDEINAASYWNGKAYQPKPFKRFRITREMIAAQNKTARDAKKAAAAAEAEEAGRA